ncbi:MAG: aminopeptidase, partial [Clostridia bacterium]|nr:aminopeptidase [Clostridia bacterium]
KYGITEADFMSAEICAVPAMKARDVGFDRSMIAAYGHDDRVCSYPAITALIAAKKPKHTSMAILADKEEIGSEGNSGMQCEVFFDIIAALAQNFGVNEAVVRANSKCLSADVNAAFDPNFPEVIEKRNGCFVNKGVVVTKFTGSRGKGGSNDASAEFVGYVRNLLDKAKVVWQTAELGKVDQGGGGTVAKYIAQRNIDTVDIGVPVISMHAPYEVVSKTDVYQTHKALEAFFKV